MHYSLHGTDTDFQLQSDLLNPFSLMPHAKKAASVDEGQSFAKISKKTLPIMFFQAESPVPTWRGYIMSAKRQSHG